MFKEKVIDLVNKIAVSQQDRDKRFKDFVELFEWCLKNIPQDVASQIGNIDSILENKNEFTSYSLVLNLEDFRWWLAEYKKHPNIYFKDIKVIENMIFEKLVKISSEKYDIPSENYDEYIEKIKKWYNN